MVLLCRVLFQFLLWFSSLLQLQLSSATALLWVNLKCKLLHALCPQTNYQQQRCLYPNLPVCSTWSFSVQTCCSPPLVSPHPLLPSPASSPTASSDGRMQNTIFMQTHASPTPPALNFHHPFPGVSGTWSSPAIALPYLQRHSAWLAPWNEFLLGKKVTLHAFASKLGVNEKGMDVRSAWIDRA